MRQPGDRLNSMPRDILLARDRFWKGSYRVERTAGLFGGLVLAGGFLDVGRFIWWDLIWLAWPEAAGRVAPGWPPDRPAALVVHLLQGPGGC
jgi:hypothetical protein